MKDMQLVKKAKESDGKYGVNAGKSEKERIYTGGTKKCDDRKGGGARNDGDRKGADRKNCGRKDDEKN